MVPFVKGLLMNSMPPGAIVERKLSFRLLRVWSKLSLYSSNRLTDGWTSKSAVAGGPAAAGVGRNAGGATDGTVGPGTTGGPVGVSVVARGSTGGDGRTRSVGLMDGSISSGCSAGDTGGAAGRGAGGSPDSGVVPEGVPGG